MDDIFIAKIDGQNSFAHLLFDRLTSYSRKK